MIAVRIEMGISAAEALLAIVSTMTIKQAPMLIEAGTSERWLLPKAILHIWGISRPTQPTCPHIDTQEAVIIVAQITVTTLSMFTLTPSDFASSSQIGRAHV